MTESSEEEVAELLRSINRRTAELVDDFREHTRRLKALDPASDDRSAFDGWTIQKIAGLQVTMELLGEEIRRLASSPKQNL